MSICTRERARVSTLVLSLLTFLLLPGCFSSGSSGSSETDTPSITRVVVEAESGSVRAGRSIELTAVAVYDDDSRQDVTTEAEWALGDAPGGFDDDGDFDGEPVDGQSDGAAELGFDEDGRPLLTGIEAGAQVGVTASFDGRTGGAVIDITNPALTDLSITPELSDALPLGVEVALTARGSFEDGTEGDVTDQVAWSSSDPDIAGVDPNGLLTAEAMGTAEITAVYDSQPDDVDSVEDTVTAQVTNAQPASIDLTSDSECAQSIHDLPIGHSSVVTVTACLRFTDGSTTRISQEATWETSQEGIVEIDLSDSGGARIGGLQPGEVTLSVSLSGDSFTNLDREVHVSVFDDPSAPASISLSAQPNVVLANDSDESVLSGTVIPNASSATVAAGVPVDLSANAQPLQLDEEITTMDGGVLPTRTLSGSSESSVAVEIGARVPGSLASGSTVVRFVQSFDEVFLAWGALNEGYEDEQGALAAMLVLNTSNRTFQTEKLEVLENDEVIGETQGENLPFQTVEGGGTGTVVVPRDNWDLDENSYTVELVLSDSATGQEFRVPFTFEQ